MDNSQAFMNENINFTRYRKGQKKGHYESFFLRANHPKKPLAFWIRYTIFSPENRPDDAIGEIWASYFDGSTRRHTAAKEEFPLLIVSSRKTILISGSERRVSIQKM